VLHFDTIAIDGRGSRYARIPLLLERLLHHAKREGELTRVMQDLMQEIFREANTGWRITGLLAEDFIQGDTKLLANIMIGSHSPFILISESFDLEYWTKGTLQKGDERIMYNQTMLPSEEIHRALKAGKLDQISETIGVMIMETQRTKVPKITRDLLNELPVNSNLWGFRLLIQDINREFKAASILCSDPNTSWEKEFKEKINLPGVLEDWNIELQARFEEFTDIDKYSLVFEGARDLDETVNGFVRWIRRHNLMYRQRFGIKGTVMELKNALAETSDKILGQQIFNILTKLTELGVYEAIDVLSDDAIVRKLPWLYS
ncbi:MAG: hypothetical protein OEZ01_09980, partial [Candidatus Heimdallarchaeota archaeon]|nr:hypothetical protein [Candidatus Heimdallarchaeota archaeon]